MSRQASAYSLSNWWPGGAEDQLQVAHLAFIKGREMRKGAGRDTKVVTGNKFEILNADKEDDDDEEIELDDEAVCDKDKEKSPQDCEAIPIPIAGPSKARLPRKSKQKVIFGSGYRGWGGGCTGCPCGPAVENGEGNEDEFKEVATRRRRGGLAE